MKQLTVLFDEECAFCVRCAAWLREQPQHVPIRTVSLQRATGALGNLAAHTGGEEVIAVSDEGAVYLGERAWVIALWALKRYRAWSFRLASPALRGVTRRLYRAVAEHRTDISRWLRLGMSDQAIAGAFTFIPEPHCDPKGACRVDAATRQPRAAAGDLQWPSDFRRTN